MDALVMAGGKGERMGGEEKPLQVLAGKPLIAYVLEALSGSRSVGRIFVAVSPNVPRTIELVAGYPDLKVSMIMTPGSGYIADMVGAIRALGLAEPMLVASADLPLITSGAIDRVVSAYATCGREALSVRVEAHMVQGDPELVLTDTGIPTIPAGINVVHGAHLDRAQDEYALVLDDPMLAVNVNYRKDLALCAELLHKTSRGNR